MEAITNFIIQLLIRNDIMQESDKNDSIYALEVLLEKCITYSILLFLAVYFKKIPQTLLFMISFFSMRSRSGGFHFKTYTSCLIGTLGIYIGLCKTIYPWFAENMPAFLLLFLFSFLIIMKAGVCNNSNIGWNQKEMEVNGSAVKKLALIQLPVIAGLIIVQADVSYTIFTGFGLILCAALLLLGRYWKEN